MKYKNHCKVVVPLYNAEKWVAMCLRSLLLQDYSNYECVVIDDHSTDKSYQIAMSLIGNNDKFRLIRNQKNVGLLENAYRAVMEYSTDLKDDNVVVILDGDDFLYNEKILTKLNDFYNNNDC